MSGPWELHEGYSSRGGLSAASVFWIMDSWIQDSGSIFSLHTLTQGQCATCIGGRIDHLLKTAVGSLPAALVLLTPDERRRAVHPGYCKLGYRSVYCAVPVGRYLDSLPPRGHGMVSLRRVGSVGPAVGSHKTPTRPPSQVLALPFIPLLSSQQKTTKPTEGGLTSWTSVRA